MIPQRSDQPGCRPRALPPRRSGCSEASSIWRRRVVDAPGAGGAGPRSRTPPELLCLPADRQSLTWRRSASVMEPRGGGWQSESVGAEGIKRAQPMGHAVCLLTGPAIPATRCPPLLQPGRALLNAEHALGVRRGHGSSMRRPAKATRAGAARHRSRQVRLGRLG